MTAPGIGAVARETPDATALIGPSATLTFAELDRRQRLLAGALRAGGLATGDRVAVVAENDTPVLETIAGSLRAGIVPVPVNASLTSHEARLIVEDSEARWLFGQSSFEGVPGVERSVTFGDAYERLLHEAEAGGISDVTLTRPLHYTSGSTGRPKGVWTAPLKALDAARWAASFIEEWSLDHDDTHLVCSPLAHSAPARFAIRTLEAGGMVVLRRAFDPAETLAAVELFGITTTFLTPTHLKRLFALDSRTLKRHDLSSLRLVVHAGEPIDDDLKKRAISFFPHGCLWEFYGATEGQATRISSDEWMRKPGSVGRPRRGVEVFVTDDDSGDAEVAVDTTGLVWIRDTTAPPFVYWRDPASTRRRRRGDAFNVGDLGRIDDDGYLYLEGRADDVIITGGVNVSPAEVEAVLASHPGVAEVVVYGHPSPEWGHEVRALVVPSFGQPLAADLLREWARNRMSPAKCPKRIDIVDELPRTRTGKVKRPPAPSPESE